MSEGPEKSQLDALEQRIDALRETQEPKPRIDGHANQVHLAWRMVIELVTGLVIGFGIGWGLDWLFGTLPLFLVLFILLGLAAGVNVMLRTAKEVQEDAGLSESDEAPDEKED